MSTTKDGGPAFPHHVKYVHECNELFNQSAAYHGMSLRDWFAGQALCGMLSNPSLVRWSDDPANELRPSLDVYVQRDALAFKASQLADAMIKAREAKQ